MARITLRHPLYSAVLKTQRAKAHLQLLDARIASFVKRNPYTISENQRGEYLEYFIKRKGRLPNSWGFLVGDFTHNLRSALDHVAFAFNQRASPSLAVKPWVCQFPIFDTYPVYNSSGKKQFPGSPRGVKRLVKNLQPYHRGKRPELQLLSLLRDLDNTDKHRTITPVFDDTSFKISEELDEPNFPGHTTFDLDRGGYAVILTPRVREKIKDKLKPHLTAEIVFDVEESRTGTVYRINMRTLHQMHAFVSDGVIPRFSDFFKKTIEDRWRTVWVTRPLK